MKTIFTTLMLFISIQTIISQNNSLIVYSQDGLKFTVILNGIRQNPTPETNVKITGLNAPNYQVKVIFADKIPDLNQNAYLMFGGNSTQNTEYSYAITNLKGVYKLKFKSTAPIPETIVASDPQQTVIVYTPRDVVETNVTTTTNTIETNTNMNARPAGVNINAGGPGVNVSMNVDVDPSAMNMTNSTTTSTYTTTTTTVSGGHSELSNNSYVLEGYNGVYGCPYPMGKNDFESAKKSIASKGFDESKLTIAKQIIGSNCMLCSQIKELMLLMSFEETRLDLAKFAWNHNLDRGNYFKLNDAFSFESSINDLNEYTQSH